MNRKDGFAIARREMEVIRGRLLSFGITHNQMNNHGHVSDEKLREWLDARQSEMQRFFCVMPILKAYLSIKGEMTTLRSARRSTDRRTIVERAVSRAKIRASITWNERVKTKYGLTATFGISPVASCSKTDSFVHVNIGMMWRRKVYDEGIAAPEGKDGRVFVVQAEPKSSAYLKANGIDCWEALVTDSSKTREPEEGFVFRFPSGDGVTTSIYHQNFKRGGEVAMKRMSEAIIELME
jgi:hypothetical protein